MGLTLGRGHGERVRLVVSRPVEIWVTVWRRNGDCGLLVEAPVDVAITREELVPVEQRPPRTDSE